MASSSSSTVLYFRANSNIVLTKRKVITYHNTNKFNENDARTRNWHEIRVHHNAKYSKNDILRALFNTLGNITFYPVKYSEGYDTDKFYVRICFDALKELFKNYLILKTPSGTTRLYLTVRLNVADYAKGQIIPEHKIEIVIEQQFKSLKTHCGVPDVLNLENMMDHIELDEVIIYLGIGSIFSVLCEKLANMHHVVNEINGIILSNNNIKSLSGITRLAQAKFDIVDLRLNNIRDIEQIYQLKCIGIKELNIAGNPIMNDTNTLRLIKGQLTGIVKLNGALLKDIDNIADVSNVDPCEVELNGKLVFVDKFRDFYITESDKKWHQIKIEHKGRYTREEIVKAIFDFFAAKEVMDLFLICYYKTGKNEDSFLVRRQYYHLKLLLHQYNLTIPIYDETLKLKLILDAGEYRSEHISEETISSALQKRYADRILNLSNFVSSPEFKDRLLFNINSPKVYGIYLTNFVHKYKDIIEINLSGNGIRNGRGMKSLRETKMLRLLNLANNDFHDLKDLDTIKGLPITALVLDRNPLCAKYKLSKDYIVAVKAYFPNISVLDDTELKLEGPFIPKKNYLCNLEAFDLVEQFVGKYFKLFDSQNKEESIKLYSSDAIFTLTNYAKHSARIQKFANCSRNRSDYTKNVFVGLNIYDILKSLPDFQHDFHSFTTDVHFYTKDLIIFTITGALKILSKSIIEPNTTFSFSRNFILRRVESASNIGIFFSTTEYVITNDQFALTDLTKPHQDESFMFRNPEEIRVTKAVEHEEKAAFFLMFQQLTRLKTQWCFKCLDEADYDFHKSLEIFLDFMKKKLIPKTAFIK